MNDYLKEYLKTCDTINEMVITKWPNVGVYNHTPYEPLDDNNAFLWAKENAPELYKQEEKLDARINVIWQNAIDLKTFKKTVTDWGRAVLKIYKKYSDAVAASEDIGQVMPEAGLTPEPVEAN